MALAYLTHRMSKESPQRFQALIVDHDAQPNSARDARRTKNALRNIFERSGAQS